MKNRPLAGVTFPAPAPESTAPAGRASTRVPIASGVAPRQEHEFEAEIRERLQDLHCPEHDEPARVRFSVSPDGAVQVYPVGCCGVLDRMILAALREYETLVPPA